jgi:hypothetical protein
MNIQHTDDGKKGQFYIEIGDTKKAEMTYVWAGTTKIIIDHTEIDDSLRGKGVGKKLVLKAVKFAREKEISILPLCPFAKSVFDKEAAFRDVL